jgi:hypothetical protein
VRSPELLVVLDANAFELGQALALPAIAERPFLAKSVPHRTADSRRRVVREGRAAVRIEARGRGDQADAPVCDEIVERQRRGRRTNQLRGDGPDEGEMRANQLVARRRARGVLGRVCVSGGRLSVHRGSFLPWWDGRTYGKRDASDGRRCFREESPVVRTQRCKEAVKAARKGRELYGGATYPRARRRRESRTSAGMPSLFASDSTFRPQAA